MACNKPVKMRPKSRNSTAVPEVYVRCNRCLGCLKDKARELSQRMSDEAVHFTDDSHYINACWFTLTYADCHLPILPQYGNRADEIKEQLKILKSCGRCYAEKSPVYAKHSVSILPDYYEHRINPNDYRCGCEHNELVRELNKYSTLRKLDVQTFIKDLREHLSYHKDIKIRYFYCGEYGSISDRPHYHITVYGLSAGYSNKTISRITKDITGTGIIFDNRKSLSMAKYDYYLLKKKQAQWHSTNELLQKIWKYGEVRKLCDCTSKGCFNYTAKYMLKQARINYRKTLVEAKGRVATAKKDKILIMCDKNGRLAPFRQYSKALGLGFNRELPASVVASADVFTNAATAGSSPVSFCGAWATSYVKNIYGLYPDRYGYGKVGTETGFVSIPNYYLKVLHSSKAGQKILGELRRFYNLKDWFKKNPNVKGKEAVEKARFNEAQERNKEIVQKLNEDLMNKNRYDIND